MFRKVLTRTILSISLVFFTIVSSSYAKNNTIEKNKLIHFYNIAYVIGNKYNINPFILLGIAYQESHLQPYTININKFNKKVSVITDVNKFLGIFYYIFSSIKDNTNYYRLINNNCKIRIILYDNTIKKQYHYNLILKTYNSKVKILHKIVNFYSLIEKKFLNLKQKNHNISFLIQLKTPLGIIASNKNSIIKLLTYFLNYTNNIDLGITQINYKYWIKPSKINPLLVFIPEYAFDFTGQILNQIKKSNRKIGNFEMIKRYHHNSKLGIQYAYNVVENMQFLYKKIISYYRNELALK
ncbi:hypothetical protein DEFDS_P222 (plasmid) [Deferribacter desulfuricans SSM1]|uniref:Transglycosylase SLT domain-containing protein n=1 Tax=Deferribacter desulfuricans (strain DSM 14783 / JCM 11476 / NBRC 101012 / SSM1) TaxID=639282 RepID=D3PF50_DEFDS|nr:hypothetical protein [Deferribacter desulfuricans]BAI81842.1 hypothetical protein DEFDS_P222 [Deferribacter desulfuricans SSM1]